MVHSADTAAASAASVVVCVLLLACKVWMANWHFSQTSLFMCPSDSGLPGNREKVKKGYKRLTTYHLKTLHFVSYSGGKPVVGITMFCMGQTGPKGKNVNNLWIHKMRQHYFMSVFVASSLNRLYWGEGSRQNMIRLTYCASAILFWMCYPAGDI